MKRLGVRGIVLASVMALAGVTGLAVGAGASSPSDSSKVPAPEGLPKFYAVPGKLPSKPGKLVKTQRVKAPEIDGTLYRVMYTSTNLQDEIIPVTGVIIVPKGKVPDGGFPVLSWAHGTNGMADECAASLEPIDAAPEVNDLLTEGWLIVATDNEGEGTPGLHPYISGENSARNTIDIVRAASGLKGIDTSGDYIVWGHSQGGHSAMFTYKIANDYAPELTIKGVVAGAPPSQFNLLYTVLKTGDFRHYLLMAAGGLNAAYGDEAAPLDDILTERGIELLAELENGCSSYLQDLSKDISFDEITDVDPFSVPAWRDILLANDPQNFADPADVPLLIIHGGSDEQIPTASSALLLGQLCTAGHQLDRWVYPGQKHAAVIVPSFDDMLAWINARFDGSTEPITPTGQPDVEVTNCST